MSQIGLPQDFKFKCLNETGALLSVVSLTLLRTRFNTTGVLTYEASEQSISSVSSMADGSAADVGAGFSNEDSQFLGMDGIFTAHGSTLTSGNVALMLLTSVDGGTTYSDADDIHVANHSPLATLFFASTETKSVPFEL